MSSELRNLIGEKDLDELRAAVNEADMARRTARGASSQFQALSRYIALNRALTLLSKQRATR